MSELPAQWVQGAIGDVAESMKNGVYKPADAYAEDGIACLRMYNVEGGKIVWKDIKRMRLSKEDFEMYRLLPGDLLVNRVNSRELVGKAAMIPQGLEPCVFESKNIRLRLRTELVEPRFVAFKLLLDGSRHFADNAQQVVGMASISQPQLAAFPIPLPPLPEQKRIVAKIEELFSELEAGEESLRVARRQLGVYRQSLLKQAFEGKLTAKWRTKNRDKLESPATLLARIQAARQARYEQQIKAWERDLMKWEKISQNDKRPVRPQRPGPVQFPTIDQIKNLPELPKAWSWISLGNCAVEISDGPFGSNLKSDDYVSSGVRVVRLENIGPGYFIEEKESFISPEKYEKLRRHTVRPGDIVVASFINDAVRAALVPPSIDYAVNKADCFQVHCFGDTISADFLVRCFGARYFFKQLEQLVHGVGRPRINTTQLGESLVPLCSFPEQREIVRLLDEQLEVIERNEQEIDGALRSSEALRQAILKKAFTGRLVPQDPSDEPASELLARLRAEHPSSDLPLTRRSAPSA